MPLSGPDVRPAPPTEWVLALLLALNFGWTTLCLGGYRPETMVWSWSFTAATFALQVVGSAFSGQRIHPATWLPVPFLAYVAANALWISPVGWLAAREWLGWAQLVMVFVIVLNGVRSRGPRKLLLVSLVSVAVITVILAGYQRFLWPDWLPTGRKQVPQFLTRSSGPFGIPNSLAALLVVLIPPMLALALQRGATAFQRILAGYVAAVLLFGLGLTISRGGWFALLGALLLWPLCVREKSWEWRLTLSVFALALAVFAGWVTYASVPRVKHRFDAMVRDMGERSRPVMWTVAGRLFLEAPALGTGTASYNVLFEKHRPAHFRDEPQWAHNDYLNLLSDHGLVGFVLAFGACAWGLTRCIRGPGMPPGTGDSATGWAGRGVTRALGVGLAGFGLALLTDFHLRIPSLGMLAALVSAEVILRLWQPPAPGAAGVGRTLGAMVGVLAVATLLLGLALPTYRGEARRYAARQAIDRLAGLRQPDLTTQRDVLTRASKALAEATAIDPRNAQAWADRAYTAALWSRVARIRANDLGREAEAYAREALARSEAVPEFWVRLGVALDLQGNWGEATPAFTEAIARAPSAITVWYYYAYHLSLTPATRALAVSATQRVLRLDPGYQPAITLQQALVSAR